MKKNPLKKVIDSLTADVEFKKTQTQNPDTIRALDEVIKQLKDILVYHSDEPDLEEIYKDLFSTGSKFQWVLSREAAIPGNIAYNQAHRDKKPELFQYGEELYYSILTYLKKGRSLKAATTAAYYDFWENHPELDKSSEELKDRNQSLLDYLNKYIVGSASKNEWADWEKLSNLRKERSTRSGELRKRKTGGELHREKKLEEILAKRI